MAQRKIKGEETKDEKFRDVAEKHKIPMELLLQSLPGATEQMAAMERAARGETR